MKLYYAPQTISIAVAIGLNEAGISFEAVKVDFASAEQTKPDYLKLNPKGRVPAFVTAGGTILTETGALLEFVAAQAPQAGLVPADAEEAAHMRSVMYYLASTMHVAHAHRMRGHRWAREQASFDDMKSKVTENMIAAADYVENDCLRGDYVLGAEISIADPYLFMISTWLEGDGVNIADFPKFKAFQDRMETRDSVKTARALGML